MPAFVHDYQAAAAGGPRPATRAPRGRWLGFCLALALILYLPTALSARFLNFDDPFYFGPDNAVFQQGPLALLDPRQTVANAYLPVAHLSLWLDWRLGAGAPFWPHLHALLLHGLAAFVLLRLLLRLHANLPVAATATALFAAHPALAESVAWVSGRKDLLSGLCTFACLHQVAAALQAPRRWRGPAIAGLAILAMYAKATAIVLAPLALLVVLVVGGDRRRFRWPLLLLLVTAPIALHHQAIAAAQGTLVAGSFAERSRQVPGAYLHYLATAVWPLRLNVLYPEVDTLAGFRARLWPGLLALLLLTVAPILLWAAGRWRLWSFGVLVFALALLPFNTAWPASAIAAADRYLYLALPGLALAVAVILARVLPRPVRWLALLAAVPLAIATHQRAKVFRDSAALWQASLAVAPHNAVAHLNLVADLLQRGTAEITGVREHLQQAAASARYPIHELRAHTQLRDLHSQLGDDAEAAQAARAAIAAAERLVATEVAPLRRAEAAALLQQAHLAAFQPLRAAGDRDGAKASHAAAVASDPEAPDVVAFGELLALLERVSAATAAAPRRPDAARVPDDDARGAAADATLQAARRAHPRHAGLCLAQAEWDRARDRVMSAMRHYRQARSFDAQALDAWLGEIRLLREREEWQEAATLAQQALAVRSHPAVRQELALAQVGLGQLDTAELHLRAYLHTRPDDAETARVLANVLSVRAYQKLSDSGADRAPVRRLIADALHYNPDEPRAQLVLGRLAREERRLTDAVRHLEIAFRRLPGLEDVRQLYVDSLAGLGYDRLLRQDDDGAIAAFRQCLSLAPPEFESSEIRRQLQVLWKRCETRGVERLHAGDKVAAAAAFRQCLAMQPEHHWPAWLLATALYDQPGTDPQELVQLCRQAVAWQLRHGLERSQQVLLLATSLQKSGAAAAAQQVATEYLQAVEPDAKPHAVAALRRLAAQ
jgi:protein O-mannosyl-transferase